MSISVTLVKPYRHPPSPTNYPLLHFLHQTNSQIEHIFDLISIHEHHNDQTQNSRYNLINHIRNKSVYKSNNHKNKRTDKKFTQMVINREQSLRYKRPHTKENYIRHPCRKCCTFCTIYRNKHQIPKHVNPCCHSCYQHMPICCLLYTSPSPRDRQKSRMPSSA